MNEYIKEVKNHLPDGDLSEQELRIIKTKYESGYTPEETADFLKYNLGGGYSLEEYIADVT